MKQARSRRFGFARMDLPVFVAALFLFILTRAPGPTPGASAFWISQASGLDPFPALTAPLYGFFSRAVASLSVGSLSSRLSLMNGLFAALAVMCLGRIVRVLAPYPAELERTRSARRLAGWIASLALAVSFPFWFVATRAGPVPLALAMLLGALDLLLCFEIHRSWRYGIAFSLLFGASLAEHPAALFAAPAVLIVLALVLARRSSSPGFGLLPERFLPGRFLAAALIPAALVPLGAAAFVAHAVWIRGQPVAEWRELTGLLDIGRQMVGAYVEQARSAFPRIGGLLIACFLILPGVYLLTVPYLTPSDLRSHAQSPWLNLVFGALCVMGLGMDLFFPGLALGLFDQRVFPSAAVAAATGALAGWWTLDKRRNPFASPTALRLGRWIRRGSVPIISLLLLSLGFIHGRLLASANDQKLSLLARDAIESLDGRRWMLHNSPFDDLFRATAADVGVDVRIVHLGKCTLIPYRRWLASLFREPRERSLAGLGAGPLLAEWLPREADSIAGFGIDETLEKAGLRARPMGSVSFGVPVAAQLDARYAERQAGIWRTYPSEPDPLFLWSGVRVWRLIPQLHMSRAANNAGVELEAEGRTGDARIAYDAALRILPENPVARINRTALRDDAGEIPERGWNPWPEALRDTERGTLWSAVSVRSVYGDVCRPGHPTLAGLGLTPDFGVPVLTPPSTGAMEPANPSVLESWETAFETALRTGDLQGARARLESARKTATAGYRLSLRQAELEAASDHAAAAREAIRNVRVPESDAAAWVLLARLAQALGEGSALEPVRAALKSPLMAPTPDQDLAFAGIFLAQGAYADVPARLERVFRARPRDVDGWALALRLAVAQGRADDALRAVARVLSEDPGHREANQILGSVHLFRGELDEAEAALQVSLRRGRTAEALNDLANVRLLRHAPEDVIALAREAVDVNPALDAAWDTLACGLLEAGRLDEAQSAADRAVALKPGEPWFYWHRAKVARARGNTAVFEEIRTALDGVRQKLPPDLVREMDAE